MMRIAMWFLAAMLSAGALVYGAMTELRRPR